MKNNFTKNNLQNDTKWKNVKSNSVGSGGPTNVFQVGKAGEDHKEAFQSLKQLKQRWESKKSSVWV